VSDFRRPVDKTRLARWEMLRRRDTLGGSLLKRSSAKEQDVLQQSRKQQSRKCMSDIEQSSRKPSVKRKVGLLKKIIGKGMEQDRYPNVLDALCHPSLKTPPRYELCHIDSGDECIRYNHNSNEMMFFVGTSDEEDSVRGKRDQSAHRSGISSCGRYSPMPIYQQNALMSMEENFTDSPHVDRHSVSIRQPISSVRMGERPKQGVNIRNKCFGVLYPWPARQKDQTKDKPMSAKVRFSPYVPSVRKSLTDGQTHKSKREGKRGTSPPVGEYSQDQKRPKTCQKASTGQKTSGARYVRSFSFDSGAENTDQEARKKSILSLDSKVSSQFPSKSPSKDRGSDTHQTRKSASRNDKDTLHKASRSRTKQPTTKRRSYSKKRSTSHENTPQKSSPLQSPARSTSTEGNCQSSTVSSSFSDKGDKKTGSVRSRKHLLKPPKFDGTQSFEAFWARFRNCAEYSR